MTLQVPYGTKSKYEQYIGWWFHCTIVESDPETTYTLSIKATGNGSASYSGESIRGKTKTYTVNEGTSVTVSFTPDDGYRIKSLKVNGSSVTVTSSYTTTINADTSIEVEFEAIPPTTYTLSIKATGNGSASYSGESIRGKTKTYAVNEGTSVTISFTPDDGYRIKSLKVNGSSVTVTSSYTTTINADTSIEVEFEAIPPTTYTLSIKATGNGSASYSGESIRGKTKTYTVNEGTSVTISFTPDDGYRIKSLKVNGSSVTVTSSYTTTINADTSIEVEFEAIPPTTYTLSIKATGNGSASYSGESIRDKTKTYTVNEGTSVTITFTPDDGYRIKSLKVNGSSITVTSSYTTTINADTSIEVEFEAIPSTTYTLSIKATGNGSASYSGESIRGKTKTYAVNEGTSVTISFTPDNSYRIKSLKVNGSSITVTSSYTTTINADTSIEVEFEAIPPTTYTLSIKATGNGSASYSGESIRGKTKTYAVNEGTSVTISFTPDNGYRIKSLKVNGSSVTVTSSYTTTINADTSIEVVFEEIPASTYTLSIKATGNGSASYSGETIRGKTKTYTVNEGTSVTISFTPDNGYRIKSLKVNGSSVTVTSSYTTTINADTSIEVVFEEIPPTTYTLSIKATGNGSASYNGETIRGKTSTFTVNEGTSIKISFTPDDGYRIKSLKVNGSSVTANTSYKTTINADTSIEVEFEEIPQVDYSLTIKAIGNGYASYNGETIRETTKNYSVTGGSSITLTFTPDNGYRIKSLKVNGSNVTASSSYKTTISGDTNIEVEFEKIPITYTFTIKASGNGFASYEGESIREATMNYTVNEGSTVTVSFNPDDGYWTKSLIVNGVSMAASSDFTTTINEDTSIEVEFVESVSSFSMDGITYQVVSMKEHTVMVIAVGNELVLDIPEKVSSQNQEWTVIGINDDVLEGQDGLAAIIWEPTVVFTSKVANPNLLLYVKDEAYAPASIKNVVVNGSAKSITLTDAQSGNNFYCPEAFTAQSINYTHNYLMKTGLHESRGWETIALPFDVQQISHSSKGEIVPFARWTSGGNTKPFWLYELSGSGFVEAEAIKANTPYIISMPNNEAYPNEYHLNGKITFSSVNVKVEKSDEFQIIAFNDRSFAPNFICRDANAGYYALNVSNDYEFYQGSENEGSKFILNLRQIHPFEAYITSSANTRSIGIFDGMTTAIRDIEVLAKEESLKVYDLSGKLLGVGTSLEDMKQGLPAGVYIVNHQKILIK